MTLELVIPALVLGLLGGGHCLGMCGGIVAALSLQQRQATRHWPLMLAYNSGRLASSPTVRVIPRLATSRVRSRSVTIP